MSELPVIGARAKRTHARRSCNVCKVRKTRCELPDLDVPSGPDPLPIDKACHRCKVLALPCVVDDTARKIRKRPRDAQGSSSGGNGAGPSLAGGMSPKRRAPRASASNQEQQLTQDAVFSPSRPATINHFLNIYNGFSPLTTSEVSPKLNVHPLRPSHESPAHDTSFFESAHAQSMKLHGRAAELTCAMLKVAYDKVGGTRRQAPPEDDSLDLGQVVDEQMRARLQPGFAQLQTFHPHIDPMQTLFKNYSKTPDSGSALLVALVAYLSSLSLPTDSDVKRLRTILTPYICRLRDAVLLKLPNNFQALQVLEILSVHAPLGVLPLQLTTLRSLAVARGQTMASSYITQHLGFARMVEQMLLGPGLRYSFECGDLWLYLGLRASDAFATFEDPVPQKPEHLREARRMADMYTNGGETSDMWRDAVRREDPALLIGRLAVCDKLARVEEVLDSMARIRGVLEASARDPTMDPVQGIIQEFEVFSTRMEEVDRRQEAISPILSTHSRGVESGWIAYRGIRRRHELNKVHVTGLRMLMATHYLPGCPYAYPGLPDGLSPALAVPYAISRAYNPPDIVRFITDTSVSKAAVEAVWDWGRRRGVNTEATLLACADLGRGIVANLRSHVNASVVPLHDITCIAVESAKVLMEMEAGTIHILRSANQLHKAFRERSWLHVMSQMSQILQKIGELSNSDMLDGESISNGCSNLIGSMVRTADEWVKLLEKEQAEAPVIDDQLLAPSSNTARSSYSPGSGSNQGYEGHRQSGGSGVTSHQQYMDTSDRWMAGGEAQPQIENQQQQQQHVIHPIPNSSSSSSTSQSQSQSFSHSQTKPNSTYHEMHPASSVVATGTYPDAALDQLLSDMFNYSYVSRAGAPIQYPPNPNGNSNVKEVIPTGQGQVQVIPEVPNSDPTWTGVTLGLHHTA